MTQRPSFRFWFCISLLAISAGSAFGSSGVLHAMRAFQYAEAGGFLAVGRGIAEANQPIIGASYIGLACVLIAAVGYFRTRTAPPASLILSASALAFVPFALFWVAETVLINGLLSAQNGIIGNASLVRGLLFIVFAAGVFLSVAWLFASALRVKPTFSLKRTIAALALVTGGFITVVVALHLRNNWIDRMYTRI